MKASKVKLSLTLPAEVYSLLEEMCNTERRNKSRQITQLIEEHAKRKNYQGYCNGQSEQNIIFPDPAVWGRMAVV